MADITGTGGDDTLIGTSAVDRIEGLGGNDILNGLAGADLMIGGTGNDLYIVDDAGDQVQEAVGEGFDQVYASVSYTLAAGSEVEILSVNDYGATIAINLTGNEFSQTLYGNAGANVLNGGGGVDALFAAAGNDTLIGGAGADYMAGGAGNDLYIVDDAGDQVVEASGDGFDQVYTSVSFTLAAGAAVEILSVNDYGATVAINLTGNEFSQTLYGNAGANVLSGGAGADAMFGGAGNDLYIVDNVGDQVIEAAGAGFDQVYSSVGYTLAAGAEVEILSVNDYAATVAIDLTGNDLGQQIFGNAGANVLNGGGGVDALFAGAGNDTLIGGTGGDYMAGGAGNDLYIVDDAGDQVVEASGDGFDQVYTSVSYTLAAGAEVEILSVNDYAATVAIDLTGNDLGQQIFGNAGANVLNGGGGVDALLAGAGNDSLIGGTGGDYMAGGAGNDLYIVDNAGDQVVEASGDGFDQVYSSVSYTLAAGAEVEILSVDDYGATTAINLTGNEFNQVLYGNAGANVLNGGAGSDVLVGGDGNDTYIVDSGDSVIENAGPATGTDTIRATANFVLASGQHVEILTLFDPASQAAINLTGNDFAAEIHGGAGANILVGHAAGTSFFGGLGADTLDSSDLINNRYYFDTALGGGNVDTIVHFAGGDTIMLAGDAGGPFAMFATGGLAPAYFVIGAAALDADDFLIYNPATGAMLFDADGNGAGAAVQFATLPANLSGLNYTLFQVFGAPNHAPAISSGATANVDENVPTSTIVYQTVATDADGDRIFYSLGGVDGSRFTIDANGAVRLNSSPDFENKPSYSFTVIAGDSAAQTTKAVTLTINDLPDSVTTPIINEVATPNDAIASAQFIDRTAFIIAPNGNLPDQTLPSATIQGSISVNADQDFFSIHLEKGEKLILDVDGTTNSLDTHIHVYDGAGNEFGDNDDQGDLDPGSNPPFDHNTDSLAAFRAPTAGTYYFSIESFDNSSNGNYQINVSIAPPASQAQIIEEDIEALLSGSRWDPSHTTLSYGFPTAAGQYPGTAFHEVQPATEFQAFNATQIGATQALLQMIQNVTGLVFAQDTATPGNADIRYAMSTDPDVEVAYAYYPTNAGPTSVGGSAWFNTHDFNTPLRGNYAWMGILHETGHTLGLKHGHEMPAISPDRDSVEYSVMTYRSYPGAPLDGYVIEHWGYPQTLMMYDIAALQRMYGANFTFNNSDSVYSWNPTTGEMSINGVGQGAPGDNDGNSTASENRVLMTIWDGGGNDTYDLSAYTNATTIDLRPGEWTKTSQAQTSNLSASEGTTHFARGNVASALLYNGDTHSLIENAIGGSGADTLIANQGANHLTGNGGADLFTWADTTGGGTGALADTIMDFVHGTDRIDLSAIDANPATQADDPFTFLGTAAFTNHAGEIRYDVTGGAAHVFVDFDGNGVADMEVIVNNNTILAGSDFVL